MEYIIEEDYGGKYTHVEGENLTIRVADGLLYVEDVDQMGRAVLLALQVSKVAAIRNPAAKVETWPPKMQAADLVAAMQRETFGPRAALAGVMPQPPAPPWLVR